MKNLKILKLSAVALLLCSTAGVASTTADTNKKLLVTHARNIDANTANIAQLKDRVDIVKEDLVQNKIDVRTTTILGRRYTADVKGIRETDLPVLRTSVNTVGSKVTAVEARTAAVEAKSASNGVRIKGALNDVAAISTTTAKVKSDLGKLTTAVNGLKATSATTVSDVTGLKNTVNAHNGRIGGLEVKANQLKVDANTTKRTVAGLDTRADAHDNRINGLDTNVATVNTRVTSLAAVVGKVNTQVAGLEDTVKKVDGDAIDSHNTLVATMLKMQNEYRRELNMLKINRIFVASRLKALEEKK